MQVKTIDFSALGGIQHAKYFVVDNSDCFVGSANFDWVALTHVHEIGVHVSDKTVADQLESIFAIDWNLGAPAIGEYPPLVTNVECDHPPALPNLHVVASPLGSQSLLPNGVPDTIDTIVKTLDNGKSLIEIQVYDYSTSLFQSKEHWQKLDNAIRAAAARGLQVRLLVDKNALSGGKADLQALAHLKNIEVRKVDIPQWSGGFIPFSRLVHSKYLIADKSTAWVGSENWSPSYFTTTRNVGLILTAPNIVSQLQEVFDRVWTSPYTSPL